MKSLFRCSQSGNLSTKRILSFFFGLSAIVLAFLFMYSENIAQERQQYFRQIIITFALLSVGNQALTTNAPWGKKE
jgi:vacuolar-type H+-ATPase subunit I/STV1